VIRHLISNVAVLPLGAGILGAALTLGTVVGQAGHLNGYLDISAAGSNADASSESSMPGMNMPGMKMPGMSKSGGSMPGMNMPGGSPASGSVPGMNMPSGSSMPGMDMPASAPMPATMNMTDPKMVAAMPGGLHTTCRADACTVIFADAATGTANVLGTTAHLDRVKGKNVTLTVGGHKLTLSRHKPVTLGKIRVELTDENGHEFTVRFTRTH
jgi:hypothetical protein